MPSAHGELTQEEIQKLKHWVNTKWSSNVPCELCGQHNKWSAGKTLISPVNVGPEAQLYFSGTLYPQVMVFCSVCGNVKYINAVTAGIYGGGQK